MGGDGGSIPGRDVLVKTKKATQQATKNERNLAIWNHCALSQVPLKPPIVVCGHGKFYNKETVIEKLLDIDKFSGEGFSHIKRLTDVKDVNLKSCTDFINYVCPVSGLEMSGRFTFIFIWSCGCIISKKVMDEIPSDFVCLNCEKKFLSSDIVFLNPTDPARIEQNLNNLEIRKKLRSNKRKRDDSENLVQKKKRKSIKD